MINTTIILVFVLCVVDVVATTTVANINENHQQATTETRITKATTRDENPITNSSSDGYYPASAVVRRLQQSVSHTVRVNCGGSFFTDTMGNNWQADQYVAENSGGTLTTTEKIVGTSDQKLYQSNRFGPVVVYNIPVPDGNYDVFLHFAELLVSNEDDRVFSVTINGEVAFDNVDIVAETGGKLRALTRYMYTEDVKGSIRIELYSLINDCLISGIEILESEPHFAHAVAGGPYQGVNRDGGAFTLGDVTVDATESHTHRIGDNVRSYTWLLNGATVGTGMRTTLILPVGVHNLHLRVTDSVSSDTTSTTVTIKPYGNPIIDSISPESIVVRQEGDTLTIKGSGFTHSAAKTTVHIGTYILTGSEHLTIVDGNTIVVNDVPDARTTTGTVPLHVETPIGSTPEVRLTFVDVLIDFTVGDVFDFPENTFPTVLEFGPDEKLYVGTQLGHLYKLTLDIDDEYKVIDTVVSTVIIDSAAPNMRSILGIAFDPNDVSENPSVYVATSVLFHDESVAWKGIAVNGKVTKVSGVDLTITEDIVTGLPVSGSDHGVNGLAFGNNKELYILVGGLTNAGVPSNRYGFMEEISLSGGTLVADLSKDDFDGEITYKQSNGDQTGGFDVTVHAAGLRNPFNIILHSNGLLYSTDNGPNGGYGGKSTSCTTSDKDPAAEDELNIIQAGQYYGHPNRKRGVSDARQCVYHGPTQTSVSGHTPPISELESSTNGLVEFQTDHFKGTLRGMLLLVQYRGALFTATLTKNGRGVEEVYSLRGSGSGGLDLTQGPDGTIFISQPGGDRVIYTKPIDASSAGVTLKSVFPRRGPKGGKNKITVFGDNFTMLDKSTTTVKVGGSTCGNVKVFKAGGRLSCKVPAGAGNADIVVDDGTHSSTLKRAYRYAN